MWSLESLHHINQQIARKARKKHRQPYVPASPDEISLGLIPNFGPYVPDGWEKTEQEWFCDKSG